MTQLSEKTAENLKKVRAINPLIHNITNFVVMNFTANVLLAAGASPVMAHAEDEVEEMVGFAGALVLNIGTLTNIWVESMIKAGHKCSELGKPVVLDPVGSGATMLRTSTTKRLIEETSISIIRGNSSEILSLGDNTSKTRGVDSIHSVDDAADAAISLASELGTTLSITGPIDLVTDGKRLIRTENGHPLMPYVTGTGCAATAIIGAFAAVDPDPVTATATALAYYGLAGELAGKLSSGPGSFTVNLLDALHNLTPEDVKRGVRIRQYS